MNKGKRGRKEKNIGRNSLEEKKSDAGVKTVARKRSKKDGSHIAKGKKKGSSLPAFSVSSYLALGL